MGGTAKPETKEVKREVVYSVTKKGRRHLMSHIMDDIGATKSTQMRLLLDQSSRAGATRYRLLEWLQDWITRTEALLLREANTKHKDRILIAVACHRNVVMNIDSLLLTALAKGYLVGT
jgi:hypothetical protein